MLVLYSAILYLKLIIISVCFTKGVRVCVRAYNCNCLTKAFDQKYNLHQEYSLH